jgi:hypothetical protein
LRTSAQMWLSSFSVHKSYLCLRSN